MSQTDSADDMSVKDHAAAADALAETLDTEPAAPGPAAPEPACDPAPDLDQPTPAPGWAGHALPPTEASSL